MMRLPPFTYARPRALAEAVDLLAEHRDEAMVVAGGTDLYPNMKRRQQEPKVVIGLRTVPELRGVGLLQDGWLRIGPLTSLDALANDPLVQQRYPALSHAAGEVSTPHLRIMGTLGGNLCLDTRCNYYDQSYHWRKSIDFCMKKDGDICWVAPSSPRCWAVSSSDCAPVTIALGARIRLVGSGRDRTIPAEALFHDDGIAYLRKEPDEILTDVLLPPVATNGQPALRNTYWKLRRRGSFDFPIVGVAVSLRLDAGVVRDVRIVLGAVGSRPVLATDAAAQLEGQPPDPALLEEVAKLAWREARPLDNTDLNYAWRKRMARVYVLRALRDAVGLAPVEAPSIPTSP